MSAHARIFDALEQIGRRALALQRFAHHAHHLEGGALRAWMRREDHRVEALQRVDAGVRRRELRVGGWNQRGDHAGRLRVLDESTFGNFLNDAGALLAQGIAQHTENLQALALAAFGIPQAALFDAHGDDAVERLLVRRRPPQRLAQPVDARLVVAGDRAHGGACARDHRDLFAPVRLRLPVASHQYSRTSSYIQCYMYHTVHVTWGTQAGGARRAMETAARSASR